MTDEKTPELLSKQRKDEIVAALQKKGVPRACPICGTGNWTIADGYFNQTIQNSLKGFRLGGISIPSIAIICQNCGFMSQHALGALGLLPADDAEENKK